MSSINETILECDELLRAGKIHQAALKLKANYSPRIPREKRRTYATLCRRSGLVSLGLKILTPIVRAENPLRGQPATAAETVEYASLLQCCGSTKEALNLLSQVDHNHAPESLLATAFCLFGIWEYHSSIPYLEKYYSIVTEKYSRLVAKVNLAAALVAVDELTTAREMILECLDECERDGHLRLRGNLHELLAQVHLFLNNLNEARLSLDSAKEAIVGTDNSDSLYIKKWRAFLNSRKENSIAPLVEFRKLAVDAASAESVRQTDYLCLLIEFSERRFNELYFGTPFLAYRKRIENTFKHSPKSDFFIFGNSEAHSIDVASGRLSEAVFLSKGSLTHRALDVLSQDFYQAPGIGQLFGELYPGEYFNYSSSPDRIHHVLGELRRWLRSNDLGIEVNSKQGLFQISLDHTVSLRVPRVRMSLDKFSKQMTILENVFGKEGSFSARQAKNSLELSVPAIKRFLSKACSKNLLERYGKSSATIYFFK